MVINEDIVKQIVDLQYELNKKIHPDWGTQNFDWKTACFVEIAEAIDSTAWKWWKKQDSDFDNLRIEIVDVFHFLLSWGIEVMGRNKCKQLLLKVLKHDFAPTIGDGNDIRKKLMDIAFTAIISDNRYFPECNYYSMLLTLLQVWSLTNREMEYLIKLYFGKNLLNEFRQNNGYTDGSYHKLWKFKGKDVEDNVVLYDVIENIPLTINFTQGVMSRLEEYYKRDQDDTDS